MRRKPYLDGASAALLLALATACGSAGGDVTEADDESQAPPPAAALAQEGGVSLESRLESLDADLAAVLESDLDEDSEVHLLAAEATTDRLLEDEPTTEWLPSGYFVGARLRQIQALADRIIAELRRGVARELILEDIAALQHAVRDLRGRLESVRATAAPPPFDSLLANYGDDRTGLGGVPASSSSGDTATSSGEAEPAAAPEGGDGPLGQPISP